jgi:hypothetical protein
MLIVQFCLRTIGTPYKYCMQLLEHYYTILKGQQNVTHLTFETWASQAQARRARCMYKQWRIVTAVMPSTADFHHERGHVVAACQHHQELPTRKQLI